MDILITVLIAVIVIVGVASYFIIQKALARKKAILKEAETEGEMIKKERILQAKEKFIQLKSEHVNNVPNSWKTTCNNNSRSSTRRSRNRTICVLNSRLSYKTLNAKKRRSSANSRSKTCTWSRSAA